MSVDIYQEVLVPFLAYINLVASLFIITYLILSKIKNKRSSIFVKFKTNNPHTSFYPASNLHVKHDRYSSLLFLLKTSDDMDGHSCPAATGCAKFSRKLSQSWGIVT
jgi:hypothetical protein